MSMADLRDRLTVWKDLAGLAALIVTMAGTVGTVLVAGTLALWGDPIKRSVQDWLGMTRLIEDVARVTGAERIIRQPDGLSYVEEPVYEGDAIRLILYLARTEKGQHCILLSRTAVFTDHRGVQMAGPEGAVPPDRQIGTDVARLEVTLQPPPQIAPGHTTVQLQLSYECAGEKLFESTAPVGFYILPLPEGEADQSNR